MGDQRPKVGFAGDRDVAVNVLALLLESGDYPAVLILADEDRASHDSALLVQCEAAGRSPMVLRARQLSTAASLDALRQLDLDYIVCVHFPYIITRAVLDAAKRGVLNLHPAFLPCNRGWHTPTWSILNSTPAGASLHYMSETLDAGDVVYQEEIAIDPSDTGHTLYLKLKALEVRVFSEGWGLVKHGLRDRVPQAEDQATFHRRQDLFDPAVQRIDLDALLPAADLLRRLRALTTNRLEEAAYFESGGRKYRVQVKITPDDAV